MLVRAIALITLGSGLLNLYSVIGPSLPERIALLRRAFPLEFLSLSRFATLLTGFALIVSALNLYKRKARAFWAVLGLAASSVVFHFFKGVDYEEAALSLALLVALLLARKTFTVKSGPPDWRGAVDRLALAAGIAIIYGVAGFWLLDEKEFGINFDWRDSIVETVRLLMFDPWHIAPRTRYALWFIDSFYVLSTAALLYSGFTVFLPVLYRFRIHPHEVDIARRILAVHGRSAQDFFKARPDKSFFFSPTHRGFLAYRVGANFAVVLGDPVGPVEEIEPLVRDFLQFCDDNDWGVALHQVMPDFLGLYRRLGLKKLKVGDDAIVDLARFTIEGKAAKHLRSRVNIIDRSGVRTAYHEPPIPEELLEQVRQVSDEWLQIPGRRERQFTLGQFDPEYLRQTPLFTAAEADGKVLAFLNVVPSYRPGEISIDLMRRRTETPNGIMDYLFVKLFLAGRARGYERVNLGMAPMAGFREKEPASAEERAVHALFQRLNFLFSFKGLLAYKAKFATSWEPRYVVYRKARSLARMAVALGKVSELE